MTTPTTSTSPKINLVNFLLTLVLTSAVIIGTVVLVMRRPPETRITILPPLPTVTATLPATATPTETPAATETPAPLTVYVTGAVNNPDTVLVLPPGSRAQAAIEGAGGFSDDANRTAINLAAPLRDGDQIHVPTLDESTPLTPASSEGGIIRTSEPSPLPQSDSSALININTATQAELETLPRIGPALAQRIIAYRESNGPFQTIEDLLNVSGIGETTLNQLRDKITAGP